MRRRCVLAAVAMGAVACAHPTNVPSDAAVGDAPASDAPGDATYSYSVSLCGSTMVASALLPCTISITGKPGDAVVLVLDRNSAGGIAPSAITLDASGNGTAVFTPCPDVTPGCTGPANLSLAMASDPATTLATAAFTLVAPTEVGEVSPCLSGGNVLYLHGNDFIYNGTVQTDATTSWSDLATPDQLELDVGGSSYRGIFSLVNLLEPLAPGVYSGAQRAEFADPGHPGLEVIALSHGCNKIDGRFKVHDYTADPVLGTVYSVTISFEQVCDGEPTELVGCFHYESTPPTPHMPPPPDPTKVSVQVLSLSHDGTPDVNATAIFSDASGVVLDTQVDMYGEAQASLPSGGTLTVIQFDSVDSYEYVRSYRGVETGDHIVVNPIATRAGASDMMLAGFTPAANIAGMTMFTACGGGSWSSSGTGPTGADLTFYDGCRTPTFEMLTYVYFVNNVPPQQFVWQTGLTHVANGNVAVGTSMAPMGTATVTLSNVPASSPSVNVTWSTKIGATPVQMGGKRIDVPVAGSQSISVPNAPGAGDGAVVEVDTFLSGASSEARIVDQSGAPSAITVDFAAQVIPIVSQAHQTTTGANWTETSGTADIRTVYWSAKMQSGVIVRWTLVEPDDGLASTTLPSLPPSHAAQDPTADPNAQLLGGSITYIDYDTIAGFTLTPPSSDYHSHSCTASAFPP